MPITTVPRWKKVLAFIVDFAATFFVFGYIISYVTGDTTSDGFSLQGIPALILFVIIIAYFVLMNKYAGGTLGKRLFGIAKQ